MISNSPNKPSSEATTSTSSFEPSIINAPAESSTNTIRISTSEGDTRGTVEDREYCFVVPANLRVRGVNLNVQLDLKIDEKMLAAATERVDDTRSLKPGGSQPSKFNVSISEPSFSAPRHRDIPSFSNSENKSQDVSSTTSEQSCVEDDLVHNKSLKRRGSNLSVASNECEEVPVSSSFEHDFILESSAKRSLIDDECEVSTSAIEHGLDQNIDDSLDDGCYDRLSNSSSSMRDASTSKNFPQSETPNPSEAAFSGDQDTSKQSVSNINSPVNDVNADSGVLAESADLNRKSIKKQKGVIIYCSFTDKDGKQCRQRSITSYIYCIRHILLDPDAPYKKCQHRRKPKNKNEDPQFCTNAIRSDKPENYCSTHMIMNGLKDPKVKKGNESKANVKGKKASSSLIDDEDFNNLDFQDFDNEDDDMQNSFEPRQISEVESNISSSIQRSSNTNEKYVDQRNFAGGIVMEPPPPYSLPSRYSSGGASYSSVGCLTPAPNSSGIVDFATQQPNFRSLEAQQQSGACILNQQSPNFTKSVASAPTVSRFPLPSIEMCPPVANILQQSKAAPPMPCSIMRPQHFSSPLKRDFDTIIPQNLPPNMEQLCHQRSQIISQQRSDRNSSNYGACEAGLQDNHLHGKSPCTQLSQPGFLVHHHSVIEDSYHPKLTQYVRSSTTSDGSVLTPHHQSSTPTFFVPTSPIQQQQHPLQFHQQHFGVPPQSPVSLPTQFISRTSTPGSISSGGPASFPSSCPPRPPSQQFQQRRDSIRRPSSSMLMAPNASGALSSLSPPVHATIQHNFPLSRVLLDDGATQQCSGTDRYSLPNKNVTSQSQNSVSRIVKQHPQLAAKLLQPTIMSATIMQQRTSQYSNLNDSRDLAINRLESFQTQSLSENESMVFQQHKLLPLEFDDQRQSNNFCDPNLLHTRQQITNYLPNEENQVRRAVKRPSYVDYPHPKRQQTIYSSENIKQEPNGCLYEPPASLHYAVKAEKNILIDGKNDHKFFNDYNGMIVQQNMKPLTDNGALVFRKSAAMRSTLASPLAYLNIEPPPVRYNVNTVIQLSDSLTTYKEQEDKICRDGCESANKLPQQRVIKLRQKRQKVRIRGRFRNYPRVEEMCQIIEGHDFDRTDLFPLGLEPSDEDSSSDESFPCIGGMDWHLSKHESFLKNGSISARNDQAQRLELYLLKKQLRLESLRLFQHAKVSIPMNDTAELFPNSVGASLRIRRMNKRREQIDGVQRSRLRRCVYKQPKSEIDEHSHLSIIRCMNYALPNAHHCTEHISIVVEQRLFVYCNYSCCREPVVFTDSLLFNGLCRKHFNEQNCSRKATRSSTAAKQQRQSSLDSSLPHISNQVGQNSCGREHNSQETSNRYFLSGQQRSTNHTSSQSFDNHSNDHLNNDVDVSDVYLKDLGFDGREFNDILARLPEEALDVATDIEDDNGFLYDISKLDAGEDAFKNAMMHPNTHSWADLEQFLMEQDGFQQQEAQGENIINSHFNGGGPTMAPTSSRYLSNLPPLCGNNASHRQSNKISSSLFERHHENSSL